MHRLEAVARVGQGPRHDDRHGVVEEGALHLLLDLDRLDAAEVDRGAVVVVAVVGRRSVGSSCVAQMSRNRTSLALVCDEVLALLDVVAHEDAT